jgi:hypothetical protein
MPTAIGDQVRLHSPDLGLTTGESYRLVRKTTIWSVDQPKIVTGEFANKRDRLSKLLTRASRDLNVNTNTSQGYQSITHYGGAPLNFSGDALPGSVGPVDFDFFIDDEASILSAELNFIITPFRSDIRLNGALSTYNPYEDSNAPGAMTIIIDGITLASALDVPFDGTHKIDLLGYMATPGWHRIIFSTASGKGCVTPSVIVKTLHL